MPTSDRRRESYGMTEDPAAAHPVRAQTHSRPLRRLASATSALLVSATLFAGLYVSRSDAASPTSDPSQAVAAGRDPATLAAMEAMVDDGTPGVIARVNRHHQHWSATAGVADLERQDRATRLSTSGLAASPRPSPL